MLQRDSSINTQSTEAFSNFDRDVFVGGFASWQPRFALVLHSNLSSPHIVHAV